LAGTVPRPGGLHEPGAWYGEDEHLWSFSPQELFEMTGRVGFSTLRTELVCGDQWIAFRCEK
jgi:hypothetical protein